MELSGKQINEFKRLFKAEYDLDLTNQEALLQSQQVINIVATIINKSNNMKKYAPEKNGSP